MEGLSRKLHVENAEQTSSVKETVERRQPLYTERIYKNCRHHRRSAYFTDVAIAMFVGVARQTCDVEHIVSAFLSRCRLQRQQP